MSMQHSLEVRTPFLSAKVARFAERLPELVMVRAGRGKLILREVAYRYLPRRLVDLPKQGFGMPMSDWARNSLLNITSKLLENDDSRLQVAFGPEAIRRFMTRQRTHGSFVTYEVWAIATLELWLRHHPAAVPPMAERRARNSSVTSISSEQKLSLIEIGPAIYLAETDVTEPMQRSDISRIVRQALVTIRLRDRPTDAALSGSLRGEYPRDLIELPAWNFPLTPRDLTYLAPLRGATLLFYEGGAALNFGYWQMQHFRRLGVGRIIYPSPFSDRELCEIELRYPTRLERVRDLLVLFSRRIAILSNKRWLKWLGARGFYNLRATVSAIRHHPKINFPA